MSSLLHPLQKKGIFAKHSQPPSSPQPPAAQSQQHPHLQHPQRPSRHGQPLRPIESANAPPSSHRPSLVLDNDLLGIHQRDLSAVPSTASIAPAASSRRSSHTPEPQSGPRSSSISAPPTAAAAPSGKSIGRGLKKLIFPTLPPIPAAINLRKRLSIHLISQIEAARRSQDSDNYLPSLCSSRTSLHNQASPSRSRIMSIAPPALVGGQLQGRASLTSTAAPSTSNLNKSSSSLASRRGSGQPDPTTYLQHLQKMLSKNKRHAAGTRRSSTLKPLKDNSRQNTSTVSLKSSLSTPKASQSRLETKPLRPASIIKPSTPSKPLMSIESDSTIASPASISRCATSLKRSNINPITMSPYVIQDFVIVKIAGHGGLSEIKKAFIGALPKIRRVPYALKILLKQNVIEYGQERTVIRERDVMSSLSCRFCVNFLCSFQDEARLYIAMEWAYGELDDVLRNRKTLNEDEARFYACELVVAIDYLHSRNIVHRDIQPRNILLDAQGHIRLGDFGYSRFLDPTETSRSFCGSSGYTAPEILIHSEHGMSVDWYSLGIVLYELVSGSIPHRPSDSKLDDYRNLVSGTISFRDGLFSERCRDLISKLCDPNPKKRMGSQRGALDLKLHMWFRSVRSWRVVEEGQLVPPYVPIWSDDDDDTIVEASRSKYSSSLAKRNRRSGLPGVRRVEIVEHKPDDNGERKATASAAVDRASIPPRSSKKTASTSSLNPAASDKPRHTSGVDLSKKSSSSLTHSIIGSTSAFNSSISGSTSMFGRSSADNMLEGDLGDIFRDF